MHALIAILIVGLAEPAAREMDLVPPTVEIMAATRLAELRAILPILQDGEAMSALTGRHTIWYDEESMPAAYQDAIPPIVGLRTPDTIIAPPEFFSNGRFNFPWSHTGGTHRCVGVHTAKFLSLPKAQGRTLPVVWWRDGDGYQWLFPKGTMVGEILMMESPVDLSHAGGPKRGERFVFEVRIRRREIDGWQANSFRPFPTAVHLAKAVEQHRPRWRMNRDLYALVDHLYDETNLEPMSLYDQFGAFQAVGGIDRLPEMDDALVAELLRQTPFRSTMGEVWKQHGDLECHAPTTSDAFSIVPTNYDAGLIAVDENSCARCHKNTGERIGSFQPHNILYGTIWGSDQVFSWHPFDPGSVRANMEGLDYPLRAEFQNAGILEAYDARVHSPDYYASVPE